MAAGSEPGPAAGSESAAGLENAAGSECIAGLAAWLAERASGMEAMLGRFVSIESPTDDPRATARMGEEAVGELLAGGGGFHAGGGGFLADAESEAVPAAAVPGLPERGPHRLVRLPGRRADAAPLLLLGHVDTVWAHGTLARLPWRIERGAATGPGVYDMKAGLVQTIWALRALDAAGRQPSRPLTVLWNTDEEAGSQASRALLEREGRRAAAGLVMEPSLPGGGVKTSRRGVGLLRVEVTGRAAHAGLDPERGVNAILELSRLALEAAALSDPAAGVTVNVGLVRGGTRTNVVPAEASADLDLRMDDPEAGELLLRRLRALRPKHPDARALWSGGVNRPPLTRSGEVLRLYGAARRLAAVLDWALPEGAAGGGSDGNILAGLGVPVLDGLGPLGDGAHAEHERVVVSDLPRRAALLAALLLDL